MPSDKTTVRRDGAADGGSHDPSRVELPVVATRNRTQERPRREWCLKNPVPAVATTSLEDFSKGGAEPMTLLGEKIVLGRAQVNV
jgi:hypothetical protein